MAVACQKRIKFDFPIESNDRFSQGNPKDHLRVHSPGTLHFMKIAIAGADYVGVPNAVLRSQINEVVAIDIVPEKVAMLSRKAKQKLGWTLRTSFDELVTEMVREDLCAAERGELVKRHGYKAMDYKE